MELKLAKLDTWESPSHYVIGEKVFWASVYSIDEEECFYEGTNILAGGITEGGWSLTYSLAFPQKCLDASTEVKYNGRRCSLKKLEKLSFYVGDCTTQIFHEKTAKEIIWKCARRWSNKRISKLLEELEIDESAESFCKVPMCDTGKDMWKYSVALGIILRKRIFLFPWIPSVMLEQMKNDIVKIGETLKQRDLMLLLPTGNDDVLRNTTLEYENCKLTRICGKSMERERHLVYSIDKEEGKL